MELITLHYAMALLVAALFVFPWLILFSQRKADRKRARKARLYRRKKRRAMWH